MEFNREQLDMALSEIEEEVIFNPFHNPAVDAYAEHVLGLEKETVIGFKPNQFFNCFHSLAFYRVAKQGFVII